MLFLRPHIPNAMGISSPTPFPLQNSNGVRIAVSSRDRDNLVVVKISVEGAVLLDGVWKTPGHANVLF